MSLSRVPRGSSQSDVRRSNLRALVQLVRSSGPCRVTDLADSLQLSRPTLTQLIDILARDGLLEYVDETAEPGSRMGRPARLVRFCAERGYVVGIDVGPYRAVVLVADLLGSTVARWSEVDHQLSEADLAERVVSRVHELLQQSGIDSRDVQAIAVGHPGLVGPNGAGAPSQMATRWSPTQLIESLKEDFTCPLLADNDANLAVLGESQRGAARERNTVVYVHWGTRIGAGLLVDGTLHRGAHGGAGEIGYLLPFDTTGSRSVGSGAPGAFEEALAASAIAAQGAEAVRAGEPRPEGASGGVGASSVFAAAKDGDQAAARIRDHVIQHFSAGLAGITLFLDPDIIVLGGGVIFGTPDLVEAIGYHLDALSLAAPDLTLSALQNEAAAVGAVCHALEAAETDLFGYVPSQASGPSA